MTMPNADLSHVRRGQVTPAVDAHHSSLLEFIGPRAYVLSFMSRGPEQQIAAHHTLMFLWQEPALRKWTVQALQPRV